MVTSAPANAPPIPAHPFAIDIAAVLFDVDGVIANTAMHHANAWRRIAEEERLPIIDGLEDRVRGLSREASLRVILNGRRIPMDRFNRLQDRKNRYYVDGLSKLSAADTLPGIPALLGALKHRGIKLAAVSASRNGHLVLDRLKLAGAFAAIVDGNDVISVRNGLNRYALAADALRTQPRCCVVIEDSVEGIALAQHLGMKTVGIGDPQRLKSASFVVESPADIDPDRLLSLLSTAAQNTSSHPPSAARS